MPIYFCHRQYQKAHLNRKTLFRIIFNAMIAVFTLILSLDQRNTNNGPQGKSFKMKGEIPFHFFLCFLFEYFCTLGGQYQIDVFGSRSFVCFPFPAIRLPFACHFLAICLFIIVHLAHAPFFACLLVHPFVIKLYWNERHCSEFLIHIHTNCLPFARRRQWVAAETCWNNVKFGEMVELVLKMSKSADLAIYTSSLGLLKTQSLSLKRLSRSRSSSTHKHNM